MVVSHETRVESTESAGVCVCVCCAIGFGNDYFTLSKQRLFFFVYFFQMRSEWLSKYINVHQSFLCLDNKWKAGGLKDSLFNIFGFSN